MKFKSLLLVCVTCLCLMAFKSRKPRYNTAIQKTNLLIDSFMKANQIPGLAITINRNNQTILSKGFGYADLEQKIKVSPSKTRFRVASISKPLTADALIHLEEKGQLVLDSSIQVYLPNFPLKKGKITPRLVAGHLAGIRHYRGMEFLSSKHYNNVSDALEIFSEDSLISYPGEEFHYSSYGWNLLSSIIEQASGEKFLSYMKNKVFDPLNMRNTCADQNDSIIPFRSRFYAVSPTKSLINAPYVDNSCKWAGGGFISTSEDIMKFAIAHLKEGYLSTEQIEELITPLKTTKGQSTGYGLGWHSATDKYGSFYYGHSGGAVGGTSQMVLYPQKGIVVVILCNQGSVKYNGIHNKIANLFITSLKK
ncbi:MAG: serine hydrolase domain-containing protein [Marinifilaceae bacterium]